MWTVNILLIPVSLATLAVADIDRLEILDLYEVVPFQRVKLNEQGQHAGKAVQRALVNFAIGKKADQREVAEHGMDKTGFL